jgi:hypothetical protein
MPPPRSSTLFLLALVLGLSTAQAEPQGQEGPLLLPLRRKLRPEGEVSEAALTYGWMEGWMDGWMDRSRRLI